VDGPVVGTETDNLVLNTRIESDSAGDDGIDVHRAGTRRALEPGRSQGGPWHQHDRRRKRSAAGNGNPAQCVGITC
jgi:hypothetical protein